MKNIILLIVSVMTMSACVSSKDLVDESFDRLIPNGAKSVAIVTDFAPDNLYKSFQKKLLTNGYRVDEVDDDMLSISTEGTAVGQSTQARFLFFIEETDNGSNLVGRSEWIPGSSANIMASAMTGANTDSQWERAEWTSGRSQRAMAAMVNVMQKIEHEYYIFGE